jgi:hypothetical protein
MSGSSAGEKMGLSVAYDVVWLLLHPPFESTVVLCRLISCKWMLKWNATEVHWRAVSVDWAQFIRSSDNC